jgi:hypothetical protein
MLTPDRRILLFEGRFEDNREEGIRAPIKGAPGLIEKGERG